MLCLKFAKKSLKVENFKHLFPINSKQHKMKTRENDLYTVNNGFSARYQKPAIPGMQKILNRDRKEQLTALKKLKIKTLLSSYCFVTNKLCLL